MRHAIDRRAFLAGSAAAVTAGVRADAPRPKRVAAVVTVYRPDSHADVIVSKILRGWNEDGGPGPDLELVSLYVDQRSTNDMSRRLSREHGFPICGTIREALTLGSAGLAVDGVLSIGEHGEYPWNSRGQHLYPRRRFFREITDTFAAHDAVVPVFNDKHPGPTWEDAAWMASRARDLGVPWMAGSSLPVGYRSPDVTLPWGARVRSSLAVGYSGLDVYGFHTLDFLQSILERRSGGERGVSSVQARPTADLRRWIDAGVVHRPLLEVALEAAGTSLRAALNSRNEEGSLFHICYRDGLVAPVLMLSSVSKAIVAVVEPEEGPVVVTRAEELTEPRYPHFAFLLRGIERMIHEGRPAYPVERTLLAAGVLDRLLRSRQEGYRRRATPELAIAYAGADYPHAPHIDLGGSAG